MQQCLGAASSANPLADVRRKSIIYGACEMKSMRLTPVPASQPSPRIALTWQHEHEAFLNHSRIADETCSIALRCTCCSHAHQGRIGSCSAFTPHNPARSAPAAPPRNILFNNCKKLMPGDQVYSSTTKDRDELRIDGHCHTSASIERL